MYWYQNLFALNQRAILLSSQLISKKGHLRLCLKEINWYRQQICLDLVILSIYKDHLRKSKRERGQQRISRAQHISR